MQLMRPIKHGPSSKLNSPWHMTYGFVWAQVLTALWDNMVQKYRGIRGQQLGIHKRGFDGVATTGPTGKKHLRASNQ